MHGSDRVVQRSSSLSYVRFGNLSSSRLRQLFLFGEQAFSIELLGEWKNIVVNFDDSIYALESAKTCYARAIFRPIPRNQTNLPIQLAYFRTFVNLLIEHC